MNDVKSKLKMCSIVRYHIMWLKYNDENFFSIQNSYSTLDYLLFDFYSHFYFRSFLLVYVLAVSFVFSVFSSTSFTLSQYKFNILNLFVGIFEMYLSIAVDIIFGQKCREQFVQHQLWIVIFSFLFLFSFQFYFHCFTTIIIDPRKISIVLKMFASVLVFLW